MTRQDTQDAQGGSGASYQDRAKALAAVRKYGSAL